MNKLLLVDTKGTGHHKKYAELVIEAAREKYNKEINFLAEYKIENVANIYLKFSNHENLFIRIILRIFWFLNVLKIAKKEDVTHIHFLYLDSCVIISPLIYLTMKIFLSDTIDLTATLHHLPTGKIKSFFLDLISKIFNKIVVHGEYIKKHLNNIRIDNIINIEYPAVHNYFPGKSIARNILGIEKGKKVILSLGGTRKDKGLDILLEAIDLVKSEDFLLVIAGKEEYFSKEFILEKTYNYREKVLLDLNFITDKKFSLYLESADIVVIPYRKGFLGQSGPLIEGVNHDCVIIASDNAQIAYTVKNNGLGLLFNSNDRSTLANKIKRILNERLFICEIINDTKYNRYKNSISKKYFKKKYKDII